MSTAETFDLSLLEGEFTDRAVVNESNKKDTVFKGNYDVTFKKATLQIGDEKSMAPGRKIINLQVSVPNGDKAVTMFAKVSPEIRRKIAIAGEQGLVAPGQEGYSTALPLDTASKLWGHIESVINPTGELDKATVVKELVGATMTAYILEGFVDEGGNMAFPQTDPKKDEEGYKKERAALLQQGRMPKNFFSSFKAVKS